MTPTRTIVHVGPNGRVDDRRDGSAVTYLARTTNPAHRQRFATQEGAVAHLREMHRRGSESGILAVLEDAVCEMERVIAVERNHGTRPDDGSDAGRLMTKSLRWIAAQRDHIDLARAEAHSWYNPMGGDRNVRG
jgi:hypothetical protein